MAVPKRKTSKMKVRSRKAANRYKGIQAGGVPRMSGTCITSSSL